MDLERSNNLDKDIHTMLSELKVKFETDRRIEILGFRVKYSEWFYFDGGYAYIRRGVENDVPVLIIAAIEANEPGKGWLTEFLPKIEAAFQGEIIFENVQNFRLEGFLAKNGYELVNENNRWARDWYKMTI